MVICIPREIAPGETRTALVPADVKRLLGKNHRVLVETGTGNQASFSDADYQTAGAEIITDTRALFSKADVVFKVHPPVYNEKIQAHEIELLKENSVYTGFLSLFENKGILEDFNKKGITSFAMEFVPRLSRAQNMDALSSMATLAGYKAVLMAANLLPKIFPLMMTAAGSLPPATVLILGAGVAGLQAIATAKRLGAKVEAFDPRPVVKEQVMSLGATFVDMELEKDAETSGGYAKMQSDEFLHKEQEVIAARLPKTDVVVTTAQIFGKKSPILITEQMVQSMKPGSVIVDIAAAQGGNCELTQPDETIEKHGVKILGPANLPVLLPIHASMMYSKNISNLFLHLYQAEDRQLDFEDAITTGACITREGQIVNDYFKRG